MMVISALMRSFFVVAMIAINSKTFAQEGEGCGIIPAETISPDYQPPPVRVGGEPGCTIGDSTGCYCSTVLDGEVDNGEWLWHCGENVAFGPITNKTCPTDVPNGDCDPDTNPTGGVGDPGCGYSDCGGAATYSALCGCVDLSLWGAGDGNVWTCIQSTCGCPEEEVQPTSGSMVKAISVISVGVLSVIAFVSFM